MTKVGIPSVLIGWSWQSLDEGLPRNGKLLLLQLILAVDSAKM
jgi:hypothetical protein